MTNIFLDACIIIYWIEAAEPFHSKLLKQLQKISEKYPNHLLTVSRLSFLECCALPFRNKDEITLSNYQQFFDSSFLNIIELDKNVIESATQLRAQYKLRTPDALQIASCIIAGKDHLFLTNDRPLTKINGLNAQILG